MFFEASVKESVKELLTTVVTEVQLKVHQTDKKTNKTAKEKRSKCTLPLPQNYSRGCTGEPHDFLNCLILTTMNYSANSLEEARSHLYSDLNKHPENTL